MTNQKQTKGVIFLDGARLNWYQQGLANIVSVDLPAGSMQYFEVLKKEDIYQTIKTTIEQQKIPTAEIILLLSSRILFTQEFAKDPDEKKNKANEDTFLSVVPFEDVSYTKYLTPKSVQIVAANQEFYQTVIDALVSAGFTVEVTTPIQTLGAQLSTINALDLKTAQLALTHLEALKKNALKPVKKFETIEEDLTPEPVEPVKKPFPMIYVYVGVFAVLILILVIMVFTMVLKPAPKPHTITESTTRSAVTPVPTSPISDVGTSQSDTVNAASLSAQIVYTNSVSETATIQNELKILGITKITLTNGNQIAASKTQVIVDSNVPSKLQNQIVQNLQQLYSSVSVQKGNVSQYDIIITTGTAKSAPVVTP